MFPLVVLALGLGGLFLWARSQTPPAPPPPPTQGPPAGPIGRVGLVTQVTGPVQGPQLVNAGDLASMVLEIERAANYPCGSAAPGPDAANRTAQMLRWQTLAGLPRTGCFDQATWHSMIPFLGRNPMPSPCPCQGPGGSDS